MTYLPMVQKAVSFCLSREQEPNDTLSQASSLPPLCQDRLVAGRLPAGDGDDYYLMLLSESATLVVDLTDIPREVDDDLFVYDGRGQRLGGSNNAGQASEHIELFLQPGRYFLRVHAYSGRSDQEYHLRWHVR
ncbi:MAG TPA: hypothetical protein DEP84_10905 [Chloroflexi bacterium]|nr:hypothetical protein [Chloroflexota bacterium]